MAVDTIPNTIKFSTLLGASALVGGATCILLGKPLLYVGSKVNAFIDHAMPTLKGPLNAALVITGASLAAIPLRDYINRKIRKSKLHREDKAMLTTTSGVATIFLATALFTPKLSSYISSHQVSYLGASLYGLAGGLAFTQKTPF